MTHHRRSDAELAARNQVNVSVKGEALVKLRQYRDALSKALGMKVSLNTALEFALRHTPAAESMTIVPTARER